MTPEELKAAIDAAVVKELNKSESKIKEQSDKIATLMAMQEKQAEVIKRLERLALQSPQAGTLKWDGKLSNEHIARGFGLIGLALKGHQSAFKTLEDEFGVTKGALENTESNAGVLVANDMKRDLIRLTNEYGVFPSEVTNVPLATGGVTLWPKRTGGVTIYNPGEAKIITASSMSFGNVQMTPRKWAALCAFSSEIEEDAVFSIGELLAWEIAYAMAKKLDECGFLGDGSATYFNVMGLIPSAAAGSIYTMAGNTAAEFVTEDATGIIAQMQDWAEPNAKWYLHRWFYFKGLVSCALNKGGVTGEEVRQNAFRGSRTFMGYPVRLCNCLPSADVNSQKIGVFGDLRLSAFLGDRRTLEIERSREVYFTTDQIGIRATRRLDINVHEVGDATTAGGYVVLKQAAS